MATEFMADADALREAVRARYAARARAVSEGAPSGRCGASADDGDAAVGSQVGTSTVELAGCCSAGATDTACCGPSGSDPVTGNLYGDEEVAALPAAAVVASLGCGNPTALAELHEGEVVLDLGSGGGIDVLLSARRVGPSGFAYGLDMTDEMLALAEQNRAAAGATNVQFLKGHIEVIPLPQASVDVVISNCVINLAADKGQVLREAFRVLRPGGRLAVSDVVVQGALPADVRQDIEAWAGCVAGALEEGEYRRLLAAAGFEGVGIEVTRVYDNRQLAERSGGQARADLDAASGRVVSAFVRARKPQRPPFTGDAQREPQSASQVGATKELHIEWRHIRDRATTCSRCAATGQTLDDVVGQLATELEGRGVQLTFTETVLPPHEVATSNVLLFNGVPLERLLHRAKASDNHCGSCSALFEQETNCRTIEQDGEVYEAIPEALIRQAALAAIARARQ
jgi:arsenite methyltransferase